MVPSSRNPAEPKNSKPGKFGVFCELERKPNWEATDAIICPVAVDEPDAPAPEPLDPLVELAELAFVAPRLELDRKEG